MGGVESVRIGRCQNAILAHIGKCQNSELESVRIGKYQNRKASEWESVRIGMGQNQKASELLKIGTCQNAYNRVCKRKQTI